MPIVVKDREFSEEEVAKFQRLRLAVLTSDPYNPNSAQMDQLKEFLLENNITLGQCAAIEQEHDHVLGPDFFKRPPWAAE